VAPAGPVGPRLFWQAVVVGVTNPKGADLLRRGPAQFVDTDAGSPTSQMLVLGFLFTVIAATLDSVWGMAAGTARSWFATSPTRLR
jgi:threonine/homoserine/homoserine lactone efflux protein